jgi:hypothetical protein
MHGMRMPRLRGEDLAVNFLRLAQPPRLVVLHGELERLFDRERWHDASPVSEHPVFSNPRDTSHREPGVIDLTLDSLVTAPVSIPGFGFILETGLETTDYLDGTARHG